ncbi:MAG: hypothetical protein AMJ55_03890 [Gammaproteobacteria bacterium SG8_15]|nr:MAG: hypothetical protein AMJ55_03890 [Gammaproteobacteria bacterium SG8_15]
MRVIVKNERIIKDYIRKHRFLIRRYSDINQYRNIAPANALICDDKRAEKTRFHEPFDTLL